MSSKLSVEEVLSNLEERVAFHREQEALHARQEIHHREERALHAAELEKVLQHLEAFRAVAPAAADAARQLPPKPVPVPVPVAEEVELPAPGRLMASRLLRRVAESPSLEEPFGPAALAAEASRRFADRLRKPIGPRAASDVLRRMLAEGAVHLVRKGTASTEALYRRRPR